MPTVIYHRSDIDGLLSGAICRTYLGEDTRMIGWEYGDVVPTVDPDEDLYIVDMAVEGLMDHPRLTWIDHHASSIAKYRPNIAGWRKDGVAACRLCWQFFNGHYDPNYVFEKARFVQREVDEPLLVRLAGEYDVWDMRDPDAIPLNYGLRAWGFTANTRLSTLTENSYMLQHVIGMGRIIQSYQEEKDRKAVEAGGHFIAWQGIRFLCFNGAGNSLTFKAHPRLGDAEALMLWRYDGNNRGRKVSVSLYHAPGHEHHDLSNIAVKFGGGGHRGACGFRCRFIKIAQILGGIMHEDVFEDAE